MSDQPHDLETEDPGPREPGHPAPARLADVLMGLPDRARFVARVEEALTAAAGTETVAVLFIDLDGFKRINAALGHWSGDDLLTLLATRLRETLRPADMVTRFGGDEFLVLLSGLPGADAAQAGARRVLGAVARPLRLGAREIHVTCCVGVAAQPPGAAGVDAETLVHNAGRAMYRAKSEGPGSVAVFDHTVSGDWLARMDTENALRAALAAGELRVHYQPIVGLPEGAICGVEALVRWQRAGIGLVPPLEFIGPAERCGLIADIGRWVLETAMSEISGWHRAGLIGPGFALCVNVSRHQLGAGDFAATVAELLDGWALDPSQLWLEITENAVAGEQPVAVEAIEALNRLGVRVAIDDFGVGHSSFAQLAHLPVALLKLDRALTACVDDPRDHAVIAAIPPMVEALHIDAVAEGVETAVQAKDLWMLGYRFAQGFHFARPADARATRDLLAGQPPGPGDARHLGQA